MKLSTFAIDTQLGSFERFGIVELDDAACSDVAAWGSGRIIDVSAAYRAMLVDRRVAFADEKTAAFLPSDLVSYLKLHGMDWTLVEEALGWARERATDGLEHVVYGLDAVRLLAPITRVPVLRDFAAFEDHLEKTFSKMGVSIPPDWYEQPVAFKGNPSHLVGPDESVRWPAYTERLDYELEIAAIVGVPGEDVSVSDAADHILGFTLLNDFSCRDIQAKEMRCNTGPFKAKDFAWGLGPWIVTPDEAGAIVDLAMEIRVNGEVWERTTPGEMQWTFEEMLSYTSQDEPLNVGDVFGSGTVNDGCGFENDKWVKAGDTVELVADRIGVLRNVIGERPEAGVPWRRS